MAKNPETKFKEKVLDDLHTLKNIWFFKSQEVSVRGIPDVLICVNGLFVAIELKATATSKTDVLQRYNLRKIADVARGRSFLAYPGNWQDIFSALAVLSEREVNHHAIARLPAQDATIPIVGIRRQRQRKCG